MSRLRPTASALGLILVLPGMAFAQSGAAPPPAVTVETVATATVPVTFEYPARVEASREVEVRARVGGILLERDFTEGARVAQGDVLVRIDRRPYEAEVALAQAQVQQAQAQLSQARRAEERAQALAQSGTTSTATLDDARSQRELADAAVAQAEARLVTANLSLDYTSVEAPAGGLTSLEQVPEGSLLTSGDLLTRITQLDPAYVNFSAADTEAASIRQLVDSGTAEGTLEDIRVSVRLGDGSIYGETGRIDFTSSSIDQQTGTILSRAVLPNPESRLLPGQFVRVRVEGLRIPDSITIPTASLMQGPQGTFVYTLAEGDVAQVTPVSVARELDGRLMIASGLKAGDRVVTVGVVKVRPGSPVQPVAPEAAPEQQPVGSSPDAPQAAVRNEQAVSEVAQ